MLSADKDHSFIGIINGFQCSSSDSRAEKPSVPQKALAQLPNQNKTGLKPQVYLLKIVLQSPTLTLWVLPSETTFFLQIKFVSFSCSGDCASRQIHHVKCLGLRIEIFQV